MRSFSRPLLCLLQRRYNLPQNIRLKATKATTTSDIDQTSGQTPRTTHDNQKPGVMGPEEQQKLPAREPLAKNFFVGAVDKELLGFPEVITREDMTNLQSHLVPLKNYFDDEKVDPKALDSLKQLGLYGLNVPTDYEGKGYGWSASLMASEPEAAHTSISLGLQSHRVIVDLLRDVGTPAQQQRYFPLLVNGSLIATEAIFEYTPPEDEYFSTQAKYLSDSRSWVLNGEKAYVVCAPPSTPQQQLFLVLAQTQHPNVSGSMGRATTIFLVDSNEAGVKLGEQHQTFGCREATMRRVHFDNVQLTEESIVGQAHDGNRIAEHLVRSARLRSSLPAIALAKRLLNELAEYSVATTQCGVNVKDLEITRAHLSESMCSIYAMESMLYLTAGMLDEFKAQDVTLESAITKYYTLKQLYRIATKSLTVIGPKSLHTGQPGELGLQDAAQLYTQNESIDTLSMFVALTGLQYAGQLMNEGVRKSRNPLFHPGHIFGKFFATASLENPKTALQLSENVHPTLDPAAQCIEHSVARLQMAVEVMFTRHGSAVVERQTEMRRLADAASTIYAMFACVARASRSYCIGLSLADHEMLTASAVCLHGRDHVKALCTEIYNGHHLNNDNNLLRLSSQITKSKGYFAVHPLTFNF
ncbi:acyl-CoA dehydrogenase family member 9, mitochondrial [Scaptodrosophila lebanonensis]|uniref:Acyl-CoA dehydrogenase family member 9, mitochondrial n=1 Tax=Drosophila lebanonensis TaxID=7225 RepID=A0A6J2U166_DROLE|nr:acyl-CoA dehydrogenase family member 9, mitochondrial [Scaptodrosophila lebanonensis]